MKTRPIALIIGAFLGIGVMVNNYTGSDVVLESGEVVEATTLPRHLTKSYTKRDIERPLYITIHHTAGSKKQSVESIAQDQIKRGFAGFAYHFAIYEDGSIYAVHDIETTTWHDSGQNTNAIGIVLVGNYENYQASEAAIKSVKQLTDILCQHFNIKGIRGHRDTSATLCPGTNAYRQLEGVFF